jgi:hypothetical protein
MTRGNDDMPNPGDFYVRGADVVQHQGDAELVFLDAAGPEVIGMGHVDFQMALERRARFLACEAGTRAWRAQPDGTFTALPPWVEREPRDVHCDGR